MSENCAAALSPLPEERPRSPPPVTPGALYRSCFAHECDDIVLRLGRESVRALPTPGRGLTVERESLTPLESSWSFLVEPVPGPSEMQPPPPSNRTYERDPSLQLSSEGLTFTRLQDSLEDPRRTFELLPIEASTPLPPKGVFPPSPRQTQEKAVRPPRLSLRRTTLEASLPPPKGGPVRKSPAAPSAQGGLKKRAPLIAGTTLSGSGRKQSTAAAPAAKGQVPEERTGPAKLPPNRRPSRVIRPPSRPSRGLGILNSVASPVVNMSMGSKLPVRTAAENHKAIQKRPMERRSVKSAAVPQKNVAAKRTCPAKNSEKPAGAVLLDSGQIPTKTVPSRPSAPCSQCRQLIENHQKVTEELLEVKEENRRLKSLLEGLKDDG